MIEPVTIGRATLSGVYAITNTVTGKVYVGSAVNMKRRWIQHRSDLRAGRHGSPKLQASWAKHGEQAFEFSVIETVESRDQLLSREQHWLDTLRPFEGGYNCLPVAGSRRGVPHSEETRAKLRAKRALRQSKPCSEETKRKLSLAQKGRKRGDYGPEYCARMSAILKGRSFGPKSPEHRAAISRGLRGKSPSEETRRKMSEAQQARFQRERANVV